MDSVGVRRLYLFYYAPRSFPPLQMLPAHTVAVASVLSELAPSGLRGNVLGNAFSR